MAGCSVVAESNAQVCQIVIDESVLPSWGDDFIFRRTILDAKIRDAITASCMARRVNGLLFDASFSDGSVVLGTVLMDTVAIRGVSVTAVVVESIASTSAELTNNTDVDALIGFAFGKLNQVHSAK